MLDPHDKLAQVHHDLSMVVKNAKQSPQPFTVVYGLRTVEAEKEACATGHSTTMHSRHLANAEGVACAVDLAALNPDGSINWAAGEQEKVYGAIALQMKEAAKELDIPLEWGGDWTSFKDWGHFQLPWSYA